MYYSIQGLLYKEQKNKYIKETIAIIIFLESLKYLQKNGHMSKKIAKRLFLWYNTRVIFIF